MIELILISILLTHIFSKIIGLPIHPQANKIGLTSIIGICVIWFLPKTEITTFRFTEVESKIVSEKTETVITLTEIKKLQCEKSYRKTRNSFFVFANSIDPETRTPNRVEQVELAKCL